MDVTDQVLSGGTVTGTAGPAPGATGDAATGGAGGGAIPAQDAAPKGAATGQEAPADVTGAGQASTIKPSGTAATDATPVAEEIPLVDRIAADEARERSNEDRLSKLETEHNSLVESVNALAERANNPATGGDTVETLRAEFLVLRHKVFGY